MNITAEILAFPPRRLAPAPIVHNPPSVEIEPPAVPHDRPGKLAPIKERWRAYHAALFKVEYLEALREAQNRARLIEQYGGTCDASALMAAIGSVGDLDVKIAHAVADLALTPVTNKSDLAEKRRVIRRHRFNLAIKQERIDAALAADETYCALPRVKRADAIKRKAVQ